mgnify:CR=1 FL=1
MTDFRYTSNVPNRPKKEYLSKAEYDSVITVDIKETSIKLGKLKCFAHRKFRCYDCLMEEHQVLINLFVSELRKNANK